tara:strand:- start:3025 stop:3294 length:270 start_codon:yes stop_codon:yes gene_type:complete
MPKYQITKQKVWKYPNAKEKLEKKLKNDELLKYGSMLGGDHPFNKLKEQPVFSDMEKHFIKDSTKVKEDSKKTPKPTRHKGRMARRKTK